MNRPYKNPNSQKVSRAPQQILAVSSAKAKEARETRLKAHNNWPQVQYSQAELDFGQLLDALSPSIVVTPYPFLNGNTDEGFHRHLGMLIDALDMLPKRPDHAFDVCFRSVDELAKKLTTKGTITDALNGLGSHVCHNLSSSQSWKESIDELSTTMPEVAGRYLAQRLLDALGSSSNNPLRARAISVLGQPLCDDLFAKYRSDLTLTGNLDDDEKTYATANNRAGELLKLLVSSRTPRENSPTSANKYPKLDLSNKANVLDQAESLSVLLSLLAYNVRNERVHGSSLSPFRSSKASLTTYASYYFQFHLIYAVAVGLMIECFTGCGIPSEWAKNVRDNMKKYRSVFGRYSRKA